MWWYHCTALTAGVFKVYLFQPQFQSFSIMFLVFPFSNGACIVAIVRIWTGYGRYIGTQLIICILWRCLSTAVAIVIPVRCSCLNAFKISWFSNFSSCQWNIDVSWGTIKTIHHRKIIEEGGRPPFYLIRNDDTL